MNTEENLNKGNIFINEAVAQYIRNLENDPKEQKNLRLIASKIKNTVHEINIEKETGTLNYSNLKENFQRLIAIDLKESPHTSKITCSKGCSFCCHIKVDTDILEATAIYNYCKDNNIEIDWDYVSKQTDSGHDEHKWYKDKALRKCVFLSQAGECRIYESRPFGCRKHYSIDDPNKCNTDNGLGTFAKPLLINAEVMCISLANSTIESGSLPEMLQKAKQNDIK